MTQHTFTQVDRLRASRCREPGVLATPWLGLAPGPWFRMFVHFLREDKIHWFLFRFQSANIGSSIDALYSSWFAVVPC